MYSTGDNMVQSVPCDGGEDSTHRVRHAQPGDLVMPEVCQGLCPVPDREVSGRPWLPILPHKSASKEVICQVNVENINKEAEELTEQKLKPSMLNPIQIPFLTCRKYPLL